MDEILSMTYEVYNHQYTKCENNTINCQINDTVLIWYKDIMNWDFIKRLYITDTLIEIVTANNEYHTYTHEWQIISSSLSPGTLEMAKNMIRQCYNSITSRITC